MDHSEHYSRCSRSGVPSLHQSCKIYMLNLWKVLFRASSRCSSMEVFAFFACGISVRGLLHCYILNLRHFCRKVVHLSTCTESRHPHLPPPLNSPQPLYSLDRGAILGDMCRLWTPLGWIYDRANRHGIVQKSRTGLVLA